MPASLHRFRNCETLKHGWNRDSPSDPSIHRRLMPIQKCPLCLEVKPVVKSHLMPATLYEYCTPPDGHPIAVTSDVVLESDRQLQDHLLCADCEDVLNKGGENWVLPLLARLEGPFPLYDMLVRIEPDVVDGDARVYAAAKSADIQVDKLIHFGMGIFFKAAVHSWSGSRTEPSINLGPYAELIRTFLLGKTSFPTLMCLTAAILPSPVKAIEFCIPYRDATKERFNYRFHGCGIQFVLGVGKRVTSAARQACFASNPLHPIIVTDFTDSLQSSFREVFSTARKAKNIERWLEKH